jgi:hypothetical protein
LVEILKRLSEEFKIEVVVVFTGLKPPCLKAEVASLENSYALWSNLDSKDLYKDILERYGASFY